jgi:phage FluMu protein Com
MHFRVKQTSGQQELHRKQELSLQGKGFDTIGAGEYKLCIGDRGEAMPVEFTCQHCDYRVTLPDQYAGKTVRCPQCKEVQKIEVPEQAFPVASPASDSDYVAEADDGAPAELAECPFCAEPIRTGAKKCKHCGEILDRELRSRRKREQIRDFAEGYARYAKTHEKNTDARNSLICGLIGLLCLGIILGPIAILLGINGLKKAKRNPRMGGDSAARAGIILGVVDIIVSIVWIAYVFG